MCVNVTSGDPCAQPKQLSDGDLEPCTGHRGYDYFSGSELSYITAITSLALLPFGIPHLSLRFNGIFPGGPWFAGTRMSPFRISLEFRKLEMVVTTGAIRHTKPQSECHQ